MQITSVKIDNYRGIKSDSFEPSAFTCIIGENNAGKSTLLLATSLFFSGTALSANDMYDSTTSVDVELTFGGIERSDINRLSPEHRERIENLLADKSLSLTRRFNGDGKSELLCQRLSPKDNKFSKEVIAAVLKGKRGKDVGKALAELFPKYNVELNPLTSQGDAFNKIEEIVSQLPENELEYKLSPLPTGIDNSILKLLPEPIYIAAVKDLKDDVKSKESATFGKLLGILMKFLESSEHFHKISKSFDELHSLLNIVREADKTLDNRIEKLQIIESQIGSFLSQNFPKSKVEIEISKPELKQIFSNARILIDDGVKDLIETKGDGVKRAITFALLRTYVEQLKAQRVEKQKALEDGKVQIAEDADKAAEQPYVFLFEEPELYLHPAAQRILFDALEKLTEDNNQVFVTTHSPLFFSPHATGTFVKVTKVYPKAEKPYGKLHGINFLKDSQLKDAFQIICFENNTAAFFANKVLLVEGDSDLIYIKEVAKLLNTSWNFESQNIPIVSINGKSNVKRFLDFYQSFEIECFCIVDSDALIDGFEKFSVPDEIKLLRSNLLSEIDKHAEQIDKDIDLPQKKVKELLGRNSWKENFALLKNICIEIKNGNGITDEGLIIIENLFQEEVLYKRRKIFNDKLILLPSKERLLTELRSRNIFILSHGAIEDYYPAGITGTDKPTKALNAISFLKNEVECTPHLPTILINGQTKCELAIIFEKIFNS